MTTTNVSGLPDTLGSARYLGTFENQSEEWHYLRSLGIGGSEISTILGLNPWQSSYHLAASRLGKIDGTIEQSEAMEWGTLLEPVIIDKFESKHPELKVFREVGSWASVEHPFQQANPDGIFEQDGEYGILEIKTARYEDDWAQGVPAYYKTQVQWYLQAFGFKRAWVAVLFSGAKYLEFEVEADTFEQDMALDQAQKFWADLCDGVLPDFSAPFISTYQATREMHPDIDDSDTELGQLGIEYVNAVTATGEAESHLNHMKARVLDAMGKSKRGLIDGEVVVTRQAKSGGTPYLVNKRR